MGGEVINLQAKALSSAFFKTPMDDNEIPPAILYEARSKNVNLDLVRINFEQHFASFGADLNRHEQSHWTYKSRTMQVAWRWYLRATLDLA